MATGADIQLVRYNTNEPDTSNFSDTDIGALIDEGGVDAASATIWGWKTAAYSELVNQSEAGASVAMSDLYKNARAMTDLWNARVPGLQAERPRAKVTKITRTS